MKQADENASLPAVVEHGYQAWLWIDERVASFSVAARRQIGRRILDAALDALTSTTEAAYHGRGRTREDRLASALRSLTVLRILLRGARDRRYLSVGQHEHAMRLVDGWGRQLGAWLRHERAAR
jgi:hypothetical protein